MFSRVGAFIDDHHRTHGFLFLNKSRVRKHRSQSAVQLGLGLGWQTFWRIDRVPHADLKTLQANFLQSGQVLQSSLGQSFVAGDRIGFDFAAFNIRQGVGGLVTQNIDLPAQQIVHGHGDAFVVDGSHLGTHT